MCMYRLEYMYLCIRIKPTVIGKQCKNKIYLQSKICLLTYDDVERFYCKRAILCLSSSIILTPHPRLRPASVYPRLCWGGGHTRRAERGKTRDIGLPSYSNNLSTYDGLNVAT